ncbi:MAG TPA: DUF935 family protein [Verrucomicrobiae bacterium]|nr:DUF935 family protein [Verrucomicrobiae bacterium]
MNPTGQSQFNQARIEWAIRLKYSPMPQLDMDILASHLNAFRIGELRNIGKYWEVMLERDAELGTNSDKRKSDASSLDWQVVSDGSPEGDRHAAALQYFYDNLTASKALDQDSTGGTDELIYQTLSALDNFYSAHEILLRVDNPSAKECTAEFRHTPIWFFEARRGYLGYLKHIFDLYGVPCVQGEWLTAVNQGWMRSLCLIYALKAYALRDWSIFNARYGSGFLDGVTDATYGDNQWQQAQAAMEALANDGAALHNKGVEFKFLEQGARNNTPFHPMVEFCDAMYAKCYRGIDMATGSRRSREGDGGSSGGSQHVTGASVQKEESGIFLLRDARWVTGTFNERIDRPIIRYLFATEPRAWFALMPPVDQNALEDLEVLQALVPMGLKVALKEIYKRFRWAVPATDDPCLVPAAPAVAPAGAPVGTGATTAKAGSDKQPENPMLKSPESTAQSPKSTDTKAGDVVADLQEVKPTGEAAAARDDLDSPIGRGADPRFNPSLRGPTIDQDALTTVNVRTGGSPREDTRPTGRFSQSPNPGVPDTTIDSASYWSRAGLVAPSVGYSLANSKLEELNARGMGQSRAARGIKKAKGKGQKEKGAKGIALENDAVIIAALESLKEEIKKVKSGSATSQS